jgi:nucleotide-binding universal stress UspA family protein
MKINKILVPTDFSGPANNALALAASLASRAEAEVRLLHVLSVPVATHEAPSLGHRPGGPHLFGAIDQVKQKLQALAADYPGLHVSKHVVLNDGTHELADFIADEPADLIVLGTQDADRPGGANVGGLIEKIIHATQVPVIRAKDQGGAPTLANIVFASDFREVPARVVDHLKTIQSLFGSVMHFVKIVPPRVEVSTQQETLETILDFATTQGFENYTFNIYIGESKEAAIRKFAESVQADLVAMSTSGRMGLAHFLFGNLTEKIANSTPQPMLTLCE